MGEYVASFRAFVWGTFRRWWALLFGVGFAVVGALGAVGVSVTIPTPVALSVSAATWFVAAGLAYHDQRVRSSAEGAPARSVAWERLEPLMHEGSNLLGSLWDPNPRPGRNWIDEAGGWVTRTATEIGRQTDATEMELFNSAGKGAGPEDQIRAKVEYMRDKIQPKAREGYWQ